ncbi:MAG: hypothetical protein JWQ07_131 [Ramlibacter sp.]|nr:hypothetical protein [Ramlibacter sp.]
MTYNYRAKKSVIVVSSQITAGIAANVIGHLALALGHRISAEDMGRGVLNDGAGIAHLGISKYPVIVTTVKSQRLKKLLTEVRQAENVLFVDYPDLMLQTGHDDDLAQALAATTEDALTYLGVALHGAVQDIAKLSGKFSLWPAYDETR